MVNLLYCGCDDMLELIIGLASGFALGFSLMTLRLVIIEKELTDRLNEFIEVIGGLRP